MYRPTVRYADVYKKYVDDVFHVTNLDRNQIIRLALFLLPKTEEGKSILKSYLKQNYSLPSENWNHNDGWLWLTNGSKTEQGTGTSARDVTNERGKGRHEDSARPTRTLSRREGQIHESGTHDGTIRVIVG